MERKEGEIFEYNGEWYQCVECDSCGECSLRTTECGSGTKSDIADEVFGKCSKVRRSNSKSVIFKKLEKVGEPYMSNGHLMQTLSGEKQPNSIRDYKTRMCYYANCILRIEIKQNKEDMEEKKLNFKPFDLEAAKAGKPVCTRDGRKVRILCYDLKGAEYPIVALVEAHDYLDESISTYDRNGRFDHDRENKNDLMMLSWKKEGWVNVYKSYNVGKKIPCMASIYPTKEEAKKSSVVGFDYVDTVKIEWEE